MVVSLFAFRNQEVKAGLDSQEGSLLVWLRTTPSEAHAHKHILKSERVIEREGLKERARAVAVVMISTVQG